MIVRILLVDDESDVLEMVKRRLIAAGHEVVAALSPRAAHEAWAVHSPIELLLTDVDMQGRGSGVALAHGLLCFQPDLLVIFMTGSPLRDDLPDGHPVLAKPFPGGELISAIERLARPRQDSRERADAP